MSGGDLRRSQWKRQLELAQQFDPLGRTDGVPDAQSGEAEQLAQRAQVNGPRRSFFEVSTMEIEAWIAHDSGKNDEAVQKMTSAVAREKELGDPGRLPAEALLEAHLRASGVEPEIVFTSDDSGKAAESLPS